MEENIKKIIENAVFAESVIKECRQKQLADAVDTLNRLLMDKAQEMGVSLYEVCAAYIPEITTDIVEHDVFKEKEWPEIKVVTTVRLTLRR